MNFRYGSLTREQTDFLNAARAFVDAEVRPRAREIDQHGGIPDELISSLGERRFLGATMPQEHGGLGLDPVVYGLLTETVGAVCSNTRALFTLQVSLVGEAILRWGTESQVRQWIPALSEARAIGSFALSEPGRGSDAKGIETSYRSSGGEFIITGKKRWTSFGCIADLFIVLARSGETLTAFLVERDRAGIDVRPMRGLLGMRGSHIAEISFDGVSVPETNILGGVGNGFSYVANTALDHGRYSIAWAGQAICQGALEAMVRYARSRSQFGKKIHEFQLVQSLIADATARSHAGRALCLRAAELRKAKDPEGLAETTMAKLYTSETASRVASAAVQVHGGNGCLADHDVERFYREAKILEIIEGTTQVHQLIVAKHALQTYYRKPPIA